MSETLKFRALAETCVDAMLAADPVSATWLGDHRYDDLLPDWSDTLGLVRRIDEHLTALDGIDDLELDVDDVVDLEILRANLMHARFDLAELRSRHWNPMEWNPGTAIYLLVSRETADADATRTRVNSRFSCSGPHDIDQDVPHPCRDCCGPTAGHSIVDPWRGSSSGCE